eukprot:sb/3472114/
MSAVTGCSLALSSTLNFRSVFSAFIPSNSAKFNFVRILVISVLCFRFMSGVPPEFFSHSGRRRAPPMIPYVVFIVSPIPPKPPFLLDPYTQVHLIIPSHVVLWLALNISLSDHIVLWLAPDISLSDHIVPWFAHKKPISPCYQHYIRGARLRLSSGISRVGSGKLGLEFHI